MAKKDVFEQAVASGVLSSDADIDNYTEAQLKDMLSTDRPAWEGSMSAQEPIVAADGHVVLSQEDIDARQ